MRIQVKTMEILFITLPVLSLGASLEAGLSLLSRVHDGLRVVTLGEASQPLSGTT